MKIVVNKAFEIFAHLFGRISKRYYFEDYIRVYPNGLVFSRFGKTKKSSKQVLNNYLNHRKFYKFVAQFVNNKKVVDVGCGSGYGSKILKVSGSISVNGFDNYKIDTKLLHNTHSWLILIKNKHD